MNKRIYGFAGLVPDKTKNDGKIDNQEEVFDFLKGIPEGKKLIQILSLFATKENTVTKIVVTDITAIPSEQLEDLAAGDIVIKRDGTGDHAYTVSFRGDGGLCLTYADCENVETVAYNKPEDTWSYDSTDITHIGA